MSWEPVIPVIQGGAAHGVRAAIRIDRANGSHRLVVALGSDVLRLMHWHPGISMTVLRGSQNDLGKLRLSAGNGGKGYKLARLHSSKNGHHQYGLRLPLWYGMPLNSRRMASCGWEVAENRSFLEIRLPRWALSEFDIGEAAE